MKRFIIYSGLFVLFMLIFFGCTTEPEEIMTAKPVVKKSSVNYTKNTIYNTLPDSFSLQNIGRAYSNNYSKKLRKEMLDYMRNEVSGLGEDLNIFEDILTSCGCKIENEYILPTYAEKAKYENQDAWLIQLTYGLGNSNFGRCKCLVYSFNNLDTLWSLTAR